MVFLYSMFNLWENFTIRWDADVDIILRHDDWARVNVFFRVILKNGFQWRDSREWVSLSLSSHLLYTCCWFCSIVQKERWGEEVGLQVYEGRRKGRGSWEQLYSRRRGGGGKGRQKLRYFSLFTLSCSFTYSRQVWVFTMSVSIQDDAKEKTMPDIHPEEVKTQGKMRVYSWESNDILGDTFPSIFFSLHLFILLRICEFANVWAHSSIHPFLLFQKRTRGWRSPLFAYCESGYDEEMTLKLGLKSVGDALSFGLFFFFFRGKWGSQSNALKREATTKNHSRRKGVHVALLLIYSYILLFC